jgi:2'-5' RNA ligase
VSRDVRLFAALDPPERTRTELARWARRVAGGVGARPIGAEALHVTVCFLGAQPAERIEEIAAVVAGRAAPVGPLGLGAPVWLPRRRPRALAIELHDESGALSDLAADLGRALAEAIGWEPPGRLRPHITVARMRAGAVAPGRLEATPSLVFEPEALTLYRSQLEPDGAVYQPLARIPLFWPGSGFG